MYFFQKCLIPRASSGPVAKIPRVRHKGDQGSILIRGEIPHATTKRSPNAINKYFLIENFNSLLYTFQAFGTWGGG